MILEMQESLKRELEGAMEWPDENTRTERIVRAQANILISLMDCQRKTSDRVKKLTWKLLAILSGGGGIIGFVADKISWTQLLGIGN